MDIYSSWTNLLKLTQCKTYPFFGKQTDTNTNVCLVVRYSITEVAERIFPLKIFNVLNNKVVALN